MRRYLDFHLLMDFSSDQQTRLRGLAQPISILLHRQPAKTPFSLKGPPIGLRYLNKTSFHVAITF